MNIYRYSLPTIPCWLSPIGYSLFAIPYWLLNFIHNLITIGLGDVKDTILEPLSPSKWLLQPRWTTAPEAMLSGLLASLKVGRPQAMEARKHTGIAQIQLS